jgi:hypothetical protein
MYLRLTIDDLRAVGKWENIAIAGRGVRSEIKRRKVVEIAKNQGFCNHFRLVKKSEKSDKCGNSLSDKGRPSAEFGVRSAEW